MVAPHHLSSSPPTVVTFRETTLLIPILDEGADRSSVGYDIEDDSHNQVTMMVDDDVPPSSEISSNDDAINAKEVQPFSPTPPTTTTSVTNTTTTTTDDNITTTITTTVIKVDCSVGQNCGDSIHDVENSESVEVPQTFDGTSNSPGVASTLHSVNHEVEAKDFNSPESGKSSPIGDLIRIFHTCYAYIFFYTYIHVPESILTEMHTYIYTLI